MFYCKDWKNGSNSVGFVLLLFFLTHIRCVKAKVCIVCFRSSTLALQEQKEGEKELGSEVGAASGRLEEIDAELTSIQEQLGEAKVNILGIWLPFCSLLLHGYLKRTSLISQ